MTRDHLALIDFVLDHAPSEPVQKRITIYRGLANLCGDAEESKILLGIASDLEAAERRCGDFAFEFRRKNQKQ